MALVTVSLRTDATLKWIRSVKARAPQVQARALNRTMTTVRAAGARLIASDMGLKVGTVKDAMRVQNATADRLEARVSATGLPIPLVDFSARGPEPSRGRGRGVAARLPPPGAGRYPHAFLATMRSGHRGVFQRVGTKRLPIRELHGPSIAHVFAKYADQMTEVGQMELVKNLAHEFEFAMQ